MVNKQTIIQGLANRTPANLLVIGDIMLDHYIHGTANRLSPEAPIPIVQVKRERYVLGGAANVALNLRALGANVQLIGLVGQDDAGEKIASLAYQQQINIDGIQIVPSRPTTLKSRVVVGTHQMLRFDRETQQDIDEPLTSIFMEKIQASLAVADLILLSDYGKGLLTASLTQSIIQMANEMGKKVLVDPKGIRYEKYEGAFIIKPNRKELQEVTGSFSLENMEEVATAAAMLRSQTKSQYIITTLSENGMALIDESNFIHFPVKANEVYDVTGAGDTVLASLAYFIAAGFNIETACELANYAAAIVVKHVGSASVTINEILDNLAD